MLNYVIFVPENDKYLNKFVVKNIKIKYENSNRFAKTFTKKFFFNLNEFVNMYPLVFLKKP